MTRVLVLLLCLQLGVLTGCSVSRDVAETDWAPAPRTVHGLRVLAESDAQGLRLHTASGAKTFLPGVNLGSTTPGHQPGEVGHIPASVYRGWFTGMHDLGVRVVRVYTLHPPAFYEELARHNRRHPNTPLYLVQGAYLPDESYLEPGRTLYSPSVDRAFGEELTDLSAAVHGDLVRQARPGRAGGSYRTDVSRWLAGWIIGVEWDPQGVRRTDALPDVAYTPGRYFRAPAEATPTEKWIARHMDRLAAAEAARGTSVPIAAANWPTTDPLEHPTEPLAQEDLVSVDALHLLPTEAWPGGTFASFHAYPYYPDFLRDEEDLDATTWQGRPDRYAGYLKRLREHYAGTMPLAITEFGVPSSLGSAHAGTNGRDQGGHSEAEAMRMNASMLRLIEHLGLAAGFVFSWEDEWFKRTWNTVNHQDPERRQLWHDPLTNEEWFGIVATDPAPVPDAAAEITPTGGALEYAYVWADHSWVHVEVTGRDRTPRRLQIAADVLPGAERADYRVLVDRPAGHATAEVRRELDPMRLDTGTPAYRPDQQRPWHDYQLLTNRAHDGRPAEYHPVGRLRQGSWDPEDDDYDSRATWQVDEAHRTVRVRIPWSMLGLADPSQRLALGEGEPAELVPIERIGFALTVDGTTEQLPFSWPTWTRVEYTPRAKAGVSELEEAFRGLAP